MENIRWKVQGTYLFMFCTKLFCVSPRTDGVPPLYVGATVGGGGGDCNSNSWYNNLGSALADIICLLLGVLYVMFMFFYR